MTDPAARVTHSGRLAALWRHRVRGDRSSFTRAAGRRSSKVVGGVIEKARAVDAPLSGRQGCATTTERGVLGRSGWAGSQRYGGAVWSGDTQSTWEDFNQQFRAGLNMVMTGIPYWTTDIGGFGGGHTQSANFRELIVRWFQWGAFCPLFRLHGARTGPTWPPGDAGVCGQAASNEVWMFGNESEAAIVRVMRMREQMRPYVMEQYQAAAEYGTPIMRPLFFDFYNDTASQTVDDQQMFGPDYLVALVLQKGVSSRSVYLPPLPHGTVWRNVFTGIETDTSAGGKHITEATPLDTFPLYERVESQSI